MCYKRRNRGVPHDEPLEPEPVRDSVRGTRRAGPVGLPHGGGSLAAARRGSAHRLSKGEVLPPSVHSAFLRLSREGGGEPLPCGFRNPPPPPLPDRICRARAGLLVS